MVQLDCSGDVDLWTASSRVCTMRFTCPTFFCHKSGSFNINRVLTTKTKKDKAIVAKISSYVDQRLASPVCAGQHWVVQRGAGRGRVCDEHEASRAQQVRSARCRAESTKHAALALCLTSQFTRDKSLTAATQDHATMAARACNQRTQGKR